MRPDQPSLQTLPKRHPGPRRYLVADRRHSESAMPLDRLDWGRWFTDNTGGGLYLHVWAKSGDTCHRVYCRHSDGPRLSCDGGVLSWLVDQTPPAASDWTETDPDHDAMYSHVLLYRGFDLSAAGIWSHQIAPCLYCGNRLRPDEPALILTDEVPSWGRQVHFVCCGDCGTRGPWADSESRALRAWNEAAAAAAAGRPA